MKKSDFLLASAMVTIALVWFLTAYFFSSKGTMVYVYKDNNLIRSCPLEDTGEYSIEDNGTTILNYVINNQTVDVTFATCPDRLCVFQKSISRDGESIVCLPHKIVIKIVSDTSFNNEDYDAISK